MTARATFRQSDLTRALKAHADAGFRIARTFIRPDGTIELYTDHAAAKHTEPNDWDAP